MAAKLTRLTHKIAIQLHLMSESCTICSFRSRRPVRKLSDTPSYMTEMRNDYIHFVGKPQGRDRVSYLPADGRHFKKNRAWRWRLNWNESGQGPVARKWFCSCHKNREEIDRLKNYQLFKENPTLYDACTRVYPKVSGLASCNENCKWYSCLPLGAVVSLFCESV
jgi:hypothetical protein